MTEWPGLLFNTFTVQTGSLTYLNVSANKLSSIPQRIYQLSALRELIVSTNVIKRVPDEIGLMNRLVKLQLSNNQIRVLPSTFTQLVSLRSFKADGNMIETLPQTFGKCLNLREIHLERNCIQQLPSSFELLTRLSVLRLSYNDVFTLAICQKLVYSEKEKAQEGQWEKTFNPRHPEEVLYFNTVTKQTLRGKPPGYRDEDDCWDEEIDPESGMPMWKHIITGEIVWDNPHTEKNPFKEMKKKKVKGVPSLDFTAAGIGGGEVLEDEDNAASKKVTANIERAARRKALAKQEKSEWRVTRDIESRKDRFFNILTQQYYGDGMPGLCNTFGLLKSLRVLTLSRNQLLILPTTIVQCELLEIVELDMNEFSEFPLELLQLKAIRKLNLAHNYITSLPSELVQLTCLINLDVTQNKLDSFPNNIGEAVQLEKLKAAGNRFTNLPVSFRHLTNLTQLTLGGQQNSNNNEWEFPPNRDVIRGIPHILWHCRQKHLSNERGNPPEVRAEQYGVQGEVNMTDAQVHAEIRDAIREAEKTQVVNISWKKMEKIPKELFEVSSLTELRIVGCHEITIIPEEICKLKKLKLLMIRNSVIETLPESLGDIRKLREIYLEDNNLTSLPESIGKLKRLKTLKCANNSLVNLPDDWSAMDQLRVIDVMINKIEKLPDTFGNLGSLTSLNCSKNNLKELPLHLSGMTSLTSLWLNRNLMVHLGDAVSTLPVLRELRVAHNKLVDLPHSLGLSSSLQTSLEQIWLYGNKIIRLPPSVGYLTTLSSLRLDMNPLRSPPSEVIKQGVAYMNTYTQHRNKRMRDIHDRFNQIDVKFDLKRIDPKCRAVLRTGLGRLWREDLKRVDKFIDRYLNADYYNNKITSDAIVKWFVKQRRMRGSTFYTNVIEKLFQLIELIEEHELLSKSCFSDSNSKPWGEKVINKVTGRPKRLNRRVYAIDFDNKKLFGNNPKEIQLNKIFWKEGIYYEQDEQIFKFNYTRKEVEEALDKFRGPYGRVGASKCRVVFTKCSCKPENLLALASHEPPPTNDKHLKTKSGPDPQAQAQKLLKNSENLSEATLRALEAAQEEFRAEELKSDSDEERRLETKKEEEDQAIRDKIIAKEVKKHEKKSRTWWGGKKKVSLAIDPWEQLRIDEAKYDAEDWSGEDYYSSSGEDNEDTSGEDGDEDESSDVSSSDSLSALSDETSEAGTDSEGEDIVVPDEIVEKVKDQLDKSLISLPHYKGNCHRLSAVIFQVIFTQDECDAKVNELADISDISSELRTKIAEWMQTPEAARKIKIAKRYRRAKAIELIKDGKEKIKEAKARMVESKKALSGMVRRKMAFDQGDPFINHQFSSEFEAEISVNTVTNMYVQSEKDLASLMNEIKLATGAKDRMHAEWVKMMQDSLVKKEERRSKKRYIRDNRYLAMKNNWRRPWDGNDGEIFEKWKEKYGPKEDPVDGFESGEDGEDSGEDDSDDDRASVMLSSSCSDRDDNTPYLFDSSNDDEREPPDGDDLDTDKLTEETS